MTIRIRKFAALIRSLLLVSLGFMVLFSAMAPAIYALDNGDYNAIYNNTPFYNPAASCGSAGSSTATGGGSLPGLIPDPYNTAFTKGGNAHKVAPALVAGIFTEENFTGSPTSDLASLWKNFPNVHPNPNSGWPVSPDDAEGPFQFLPSTWTGLGYNIADIQNLDTAADAAADYLASNGGTVGKPIADWETAIYAYNHASWYVDAVINYYKFYSSGGSGPAPSPGSGSGGSGSGCLGSGITTASGCVNPLIKAKDITPERIDQGVDYYMSNGSAIVAMCNAKVTAASTGAPWPGGGCVDLTFTGGAYSGKNYYLCENIVPTVSAGMTVKEGQQIATFYAGDYGIETGWQDQYDYTPLAQIPLNENCVEAGVDSDPGCWSSAAGVSFSNFIVAAGGQAGVCVRTVQGQPGAPATPPQSMPAGYPPINSSKPPCDSWKK